MAEYIVMPKLGFDMREGVLVAWLKDVGQQVTKGEVIAEIESDKATLELEAQTGGTLLKLVASEGDVVPIGGYLAIVGEENEDISAVEEEAKTEEVSEKPQLEQGNKPEPDEGKGTQIEAGDQPSDSPIGAEFPGGVKATPVARRMAEEKGIDLKQVRGTGPGGRIRKADVERFEKEPGLPAGQPIHAEAGQESVEISASRLRQAIGRRMVQSKTTVPHFYVTTEVDMGPALALRKEINALISPDDKVTVNDMILKAAALALRSFPNINASFGGEATIIQHNYINVGSAVAVEGGLLTVVQKDTDKSPLAQIAIDNKAMIARARNGKSRPSDFEDSTFTVSNLGAFDVAHFVAIINPPNAAIMAVGSARQVPVVEDGELSVGWRMQATLSADHRVTDGAEAARYMQHFKEIIEEPLRLLI